MSKVCQICGKKSIVARKRNKLRGKYNPTPKKRKYPNLQWIHLASGKRVLACTRCIKTLSKTKRKEESLIKEETAINQEKETLPKEKVKKDKTPAKAQKKDKKKESPKKSKTKKAGLKKKIKKAKKK
jgi:ribosomal protein L28